MSRKQLSDLDFGGVARIRNLPAPVNPDEPARLSDLNSAVEGLAWKDSCRVATQTNINLSSPGASMDGVSLSAGDRVLVKAQTIGSENGIYIWNGAAIAMTRALDANTAAELEQAIATVEEGTSAGTSWRQSVVNFVLDREFEGLKMTASSGITDRRDGENWNASIAGGKQFGTVADGHERRRVGRGSQRRQRDTKSGVVLHFAW